MRYIKTATDRTYHSTGNSFLMNRFDGLKYREIAEKLGISIKTVEAQMGSALKHLREQLAGYLDGRV